MADANLIEDINAEIAKLPQCYQDRVYTYAENLREAMRKDPLWMMAVALVGAEASVAED